MDNKAREQKPTDLGRLSIVFISDESGNVTLEKSRDDKPLELRAEDFPGMEFVSESIDGEKEFLTTSSLLMKSYDIEEKIDKYPTLFREELKKLYSQTKDTVLLFRFDKRMDLLVWLLLNEKDSFLKVTDKYISLFGSLTDQFKKNEENNQEFILNGDTAAILEESLTLDDELCHFHGIKFDEQAQYLIDHVKGLKELCGKDTKAYERQIKPLKERYGWLVNEGEKGRVTTKLTGFSLAFYQFKKYFDEQIKKDINNTEFPPDKF